MPTASRPRLVEWAQSVCTSAACRWHGAQRVRLRYPRNKLAALSRASRLIIISMVTFAPSFNHLSRTSRAKPNGRAGLSLLLYGAPGTAETECVHYLAQRTGAVLQRAAPDILRMLAV